MQLIIVTGMSGAGKSTVLKFLEDYGYYCVDNMAPVLLPKFIDICSLPGSEIEKIAFGIDIRGGKLFNDLFSVLDALSSGNQQYDVLFLESCDDTLVKRYKETRRSHPLAKNERIEVGIERERELMAEVKKRAHHILDTSYFLTRQLREKVAEIYIQNKNFKSLTITVLSFGFKYGIPADSDLVFDVRFIPNPFYTDLREFTGNDPRVRDFVLSSDGSTEFLEKVTGLLEFLIPHYILEGKNQLVLSVGCTGGKHRSVCLANEIHSALQKNDHSVIINHRDIEKDSKNS